MEVVIVRDGKSVLRYPAQELDVARLVAGICGFYDVDVEPTGRGQGANVTAYAEGLRINFSGTSIADACSKLIDYLAGEV